MAEAIGCRRVDPIDAALERPPDRGQHWRSSCGPQPNAHPPPPTAHDPNPSVVISIPVRPSRRVGSGFMA
jgi:hypothetical protein